MFLCIGTPPSKSLNRTSSEVARDKQKKKKIIYFVNTSLRFFFKSTTTLTAVGEKRFSSFSGKWYVSNRPRTPHVTARQRTGRYGSVVASWSADTSGLIAI